MNILDTYTVQDEYAQHHANLTNEVREARMIQTAIAQRFTQARNWLGARFIAWGQHLQGSQDAKLEWTHW